MRGRIFSPLLLVFLALLTLAWGSAGAALAQPYGPPSRDGVQPLDRLLPGIRRAHPGSFYDAEGPTYGPTGDPHYHLKWMTPDGRIIWFDADARNGRVLRSSPGRDSFDDNRFRGQPDFRGQSDGPRPFVNRYPPYTADPYDRGYGRERERERNFGPPPGYARPYRDWGPGRGEGRGGGRWRR
jgi:hypothetical protein